MMARHIQDPVSLDQQPALWPGTFSREAAQCPLTLPFLAAYQRRDITLAPYPLKEPATEKPARGQPTGWLFYWVARRPRYLNISRTLALRFFGEAEILLVIPST